MAYYAVLFLVGGTAYVSLELLWRRRSHWSMFLLGGLCLCLLDTLGRSGLGFPAQVLAGAAAVTALEFLAGLVLNRGLRLNVWDYSGLPMQLMGQICLGYSLLWLPVCAGGLLLTRALRQMLQAIAIPAGFP